MLLVYCSVFTDRFFVVYANFAEETVKVFLTQEIEREVALTIRPCWAEIVNGYLRRSFKGRKEYNNKNVSES